MTSTTIQSLAFHLIKAQMSASNHGSVYWLTPQIHREVGLEGTAWIQPLPDWVETTCCFLTGKWNLCSTSWVPDFPASESGDDSTGERRVHHDLLHWGHKKMPCQERPLHDLRGERRTAWDGAVGSQSFVCRWFTTCSRLKTSHAPVCCSFCFEGWCVSAQLQHLSDPTRLFIALQMPLASSKPPI